MSFLSKSVLCTRKNPIIYLSYFSSNSLLLGSDSGSFIHALKHVLSIMKYIDSAILHVWTCFLQHFSFGSSWKKVSFSKVVVRMDDLSEAGGWKNWDVGLHQGVVHVPVHVV